MNLKDHIRAVADFPKPGILFYDIATLLAHKDAWRATIMQLADILRPYKADYVAGIDARGFLMAGALAVELDCGIIMIRKAGKLPGTVVPHSYDLEYDSDTLEIQEGILPPGSKVVVLDDLLATGGTLQAALVLLRNIGMQPVAAASIIELTFLEGRSRLDIPCHALLAYDH